MASLRAAITTDVHYGPDIRDKLGSNAPRLLKHFIRAAKKFDPDMYIDLGDRISATNKEADIKNLRRYSAHFNKLSKPIHGVIGNHDDKNMSREEHAALSGIPAQSYSMDTHGLHLTFWSPSRYVCKNRGIYTDRQSINWLKQDLERAAAPTLLFTHVPLDNFAHDIYSDIERYFFWAENEKIRKVVEQSQKVILSLAGHRHRDRHREINGIHHVTINSMVDTWCARERVPRGTAAYMEASPHRIKICVTGKSPHYYDLKPKSLNI